MFDGLTQMSVDHLSCWRGWEPIISLLIRIAYVAMSFTYKMGGFSVQCCQRDLIFTCPDLLCLWWMVWFKQQGPYYNIHFLLNLRRGPMRLFHPVNSLVVSRNLWLILLSKIWLFKFSPRYIKNNSKIRRVQICANGFAIFNGCWAFSNLVIFHWIKFAKHIWEPCYHLAADFPS